MQDGLYAGTELTLIGAKLSARLALDGQAGGQVAPLGDGGKQSQKHQPLHAYYLKTTKRVCG
jgi:hypothetical protein